jgi:hypothetical protein
MQCVLIPVGMVVSAMPPMSAFAAQVPIMGPLVN